MKHKTKIIILFLLLFSPVAAHAMNAVTNQTSNLRKGPSIGYSVIGVVPGGRHVRVHVCKRNWCQINYRGRRGWVAVNLLAFKKKYRDRFYPKPNGSSVNVIITDGVNRPPRPPRPYPPNNHRPQPPRPLPPRPLPPAPPGPPPPPPFPPKPYEQAIKKPQFNQKPVPVKPSGSAYERALKKPQLDEKQVPIQPAP